MLFNSVAFLVFLPIVVLLYYLLPQKFRWILLLGASYYFYGSWKVEFLALIVFSTVVDFQLAKWISQLRAQWAKRSLLAISLLSNLGLLFLFKYLHLFLPEVDPMLVNIYTVDHPILGVIKQGIYFSIPVGISFYTFQTLSYTIDVYHGRVEPETHLGKFALFVTFFPQLVAGPIERFARLMPQLKTKHLPKYENFQKAFRLMLYGFFIKMGVADNLSPLVDQVYSNPEQFTTLSAWLGSFGFGLQIYADFAGYSLIAQGAALALGINLMDNFRTPYWSTSIGEFWNRWHISLSTWFRDYLYIPLGGNKVGYLHWVINILLVFIISGFWHGANVTFLIWGAIHGLLYLLERMIKPRVQIQNVRVKKIIGGIFIFAAVHIAWLFFRIDSIADVGPHVEALLSATGSRSLNPQTYLWFILALFLFFEVVLYNKRFDTYLDRLSFPLRWTIYGLMLWCIIAWAGVTNHPFIYFQF